MRVERFDKAHFVKIYVILWKNKLCLCLVGLQCFVCRMYNRLSTWNAACACNF